MLRSVKTLKGYRLEATDGRLGSVKDVYFDDHRHTVRHLVVDTGGWLTGRQVLIPPPGVVRIDDEQRTVHVSMTRRQVEESPSIDEDKPVSRQHEADVFGYYGYPYYWTGPYLWGVGAFPMLGAGAVQPPMAPVNLEPGPSETPPGSDDLRSVQEQQGDSHLRSADEVIGYTVGATDGELGHVGDLLINDRDWSLQALEVDTSNWWSGKRVRVEADAIDSISWGDRTVFVTMTRDQIRERPEVEV